MVSAARFLARELAGACRDLEAGTETLDVPLERSDARLVEIVDVEDQAPVRRGETTEIRQVRVTTRLHPQTGIRGGGEVGGHDHGGATVEGERRLEHPFVAERDEFGNTRRLLPGEQCYRVRSVGDGCPCPVGGSGKGGASRAPVSRPLLRIEMDDGRTATLGSVMFDGGHETIVRRRRGDVVTRCG